MSDPSELRAGVERLIAEWEEQLAAYDAGSNKLSSDEAARLQQCADELRALLAKHPPTNLDPSPVDSVEAKYQGRCQHKRAGPTDARCPECGKKLTSEPSPVEQE